MEEYLTQIWELLNQNEYDQAKRVAEKISDPIQKYNALGFINYLEDNYERAIDYFKNALEFGYDDDVLFNFSTTLFKIANYQDAWRYLTRIRKKNWEVYDLLGDCQYALGNAPIALYYYKKACELSSDVRMRQKYLDTRRKHRVDRKVSIFCLDKQNEFVTELVDVLLNVFQVRVAVGDDPAQLEANYYWSDVVWLEGANELNAKILRTRSKENKRIICRLDYQNISVEYLRQIDWSSVDGVIVCSNGLSEFIRRFDEGIYDMIRDKIFVANIGVNVSKIEFLNGQKSFMQNPTDFNDPYHVLKCMAMGIKPPSCADNDSNENGSEQSEVIREFLKELQSYVDNDHKSAENEDREVYRAIIEEHFSLEDCANRIYYFFNNVLSSMQIEEKISESDVEAVTESLINRTDEGIYIAAVNKRGLNLTFYNILSPLQPNKIVFCNRHGKGYGDSPKYIAEEIMRRNLNYEMVWLVRKEYLDTKEFPSQIKVVQYNSVESLLDILTAKIFFNNDFRDHFFRIKRKGQVYIQTWHGGIALKKISLDVNQTQEFIENTKMEAEKIDYMISNSTFCTQMFRRAFAYDGEILEVGTPRCDSLFNKELVEQANRKVREYFKIDGDTKIVLYAPTFRDNRRTNVFDINYEGLMKSLSEQFGGKWKVIVRLHPYITDFSDFMFYTDDILNGTDHDDVYELLSAADVLVTDYSSLMFEFSFMRKPVFLYMPDLEEYFIERGFYFEIEDLPYEIGRTNEEVFEKIRKFDKDIYNERVEEFLNKLGLCENGDASKKTVDLITKIVSEAYVQNA